MVDKAQMQTDKVLSLLEKNINKIYSGAYLEISKSATREFEKVEINKSLTPNMQYLEYQKYGRLKKVETDIAERLKKANAEAVTLINRTMVDVYKLNYDETKKSVLGNTKKITKTEAGETLKEQAAPFTELSVNGLLMVALLRRDVEAELMRGIFAGDSGTALTKRIESVANKNLTTTIKIAETETTRTENSARQQVGEEGAKKGFVMKKQWVSVGDNATRPAHKEANGQIVLYNEPFIVDGEKMMYPGDYSMGASIGNTINCRCVMVVIREER